MGESSHGSALARRWKRSVAERCNRCQANHRPFIQASMGSRMRSIQHWTPRYIYDRVALMAYQRANPTAPWLPAQATSILSTWLKTTDIGIEWGSGRSTVWFAQRVRKLLSVEGDPAWGEYVPMLLSQAQVREKVDYRVLEVSEREGSSCSYVRAVDDIDSESVDFVLVDGSLRALCALEGVDKLKPGGLLVVDNANWYLPCSVPSRSPGSRRMNAGPATPKWEEFLRRVSSWRHLWTSNGVTDTAFWIKPPI